MNRLATFDIFDTVLIRRCGRPEMIFKMLARMLFPYDEAMREAFVLWRRRAEADARQHMKGDVSLFDIYASIDPSFLSEIGSVDRLMNAEKTVEAENLIANPAIRTRISERRAAGWQIAFVSDMYLDSSFLHDLLIREHCAEPTDKIFVSCEYAARKDNGLLYDVVRAELRPEEWEHCGDNRFSDLKMAKRKGIKAVKADTTFTAAELFVVHSDKHLSSHSMTELASLSRVQRLAYNNNPFDVFAADFVAPAYVPYVLFVLRKAQAKGIRRLYFLSRDSYVLLQAAKAVSVHFSDIELRYLFVSRRALYLPYLAELSEKKYLAVQNHHTILRQSVDVLLTQLATNRQELLDNFGITFDYSRITTRKQERDFLDKLFRGSYAPVLRQRAMNAEELVVAYFRQEGLFDTHISCAAVDVGWLGTSRLMMNSILKRHGATSLSFFYYGVRNDVFPPSAGRYRSFFRADELSTETTGLIENYYSASPYPTTIGYRQETNGRITPVYPEGKHFEESEIIRANCSAVADMAAEVMRTNIGNDTISLYLWAKLSLAFIIGSKEIVDLSPLLSSPKFDTMPFVKRLNLIELFRLTILGKQATAFDWASLRLTLPQCMWSVTRRLSRFTGRMRAFLFRKFVTNNL